MSDTIQLRHVAFDLLQRMERFGDWSVRVWRYEHPTQGLIEPPLFWYEVTDRHVAVRTSSPAFTAVDAAYSAGRTALEDEAALAAADWGTRRRGKWLSAHQTEQPADHRHALEVVAEMIRGGDVDAALAQTCRRCSGCLNSAHHWMEDIWSLFLEDEEREALALDTPDAPLPGDDEPIWCCKHCDHWQLMEECLVCGWPLDPETLACGECEEKDDDG